MRASDVCRSHAVHGVHDVQPAPKSHIPPCHNSMQMACGSAEREKREGEARGRGSSLIPSITHPADTHHHPSSPLLPLSSPLLISRPHPQHTLTPSPPLIWLTTTTTSLLLSLNLPLLTHTHTHTSQASPNACASAQRKRSSSSRPHYSRSSPPAAHVLLHLHATPAHTSSKWYMCE